MLVFRACTHAVRDVKFSPCGNLLATSVEYKVLIWSLAPLEIVYKLEAQEKYGFIDWSPDGKLLVRSRRSVQCWRVAEPAEPLWTLPHSYPYRVPGEWRTAFSPDGATLLTLDQGHIHLLECISGNVILDPSGNETYDIRRYPNLVEDAIWHPSGKIVAIKCSRWWEGKSVWFVDIKVVENGVSAAHYIAPYKTHRSPLMVFDSCGDRLALIDGSDIHVWEGQLTQPVIKVNAGTRCFQSMAFTPDSRSLAALSTDGITRIWDTQNWEEKRSFDWQIGRLNCMDIAQDGLRYAVCGSKGKVIVWDVE